MGFMGKGLIVSKQTNKEMIVRALDKQKLLRFKEIPRAGIGGKRLLLKAKAAFGPKTPLDLKKINPKP